MKILVTGTAGFIGFHLAQRLFERGDEVIGLDNINEYYDIRLKYGRLEASGIEQKDIDYNTLVQSTTYPGYRFLKLDIQDRENLARLFETESFDVVCNLAAQAGVRYSLSDPHSYTDSNISGFLNVLENCRLCQVKNLVYASSSSVYGLNESMPFAVHHPTEHPVSMYAVTKKANELMAHAYSYLFHIPTTGLRFFTVYGPWGRPDMALFLFTRTIMNGEPIDVYNFGNMLRDFTYIDDIVGGVVKVIDCPATPADDWDGHTPDPSRSSAPYRIYNIGNSKKVRLMDFIETIEKELGKKAQKNLLPLQPGDVPATHADVSALARDFDYRPATPVETGIQRFLAWYREFYRV